ncbi:MAG: adenylate/guanylate cyclase domain-containing protein, partial [Xanthobacteraceae bacterium]
GTIDKYIGDAVMAFWNAPVDDDEHEANACDAALEMLARAEALNIELKREAQANGGVYMPLRIGIGLNSGPCVVGNMGSDFKFNYSVLGDTVNLASRLESRTKDYRLSLVIGSRTAERAKAKFATMEIDLIQVKGKKVPETVFTVLGGEERRMTILFSDVRGFTTISEHYKDDPQGLTRLMNRFLTPLTDAILERKGTIDKYIGDAIMAFWNAPVDDDEQEANACDAALEMQARAAALNVELKREAEANGGKYMPLRIGVGLNTGPCVVGNMGSDFRFNYSVLGDTVNFASRLEARTKDYRLPLVIGSRTAEGAKQKFATMEIDLIQVKGKTQPEAVFAVLGRADLEQDPRCGELRELNAQMLARFRKQEWNEALNLIARCRKIASGLDAAGLYDMYDERIAAYRADPPGPDWDGVYEAESK